MPHVTVGKENSGDIAKALGARASELFADPPHVQKVEVLANTPVKG